MNSKIPDKNRFILYNMPENGEIFFRIKLNKEYSGVKTFFCALDKEYRPVLHVSLSENPNNIIWLSRYCPSTQEWPTCFCSFPLVLGEWSTVHINYGEKRNGILIDDQIYEQKNSNEENLKFIGNSSSYISFGDISNVNSLPEIGLIDLKTFCISQRYESEGFPFSCTDPHIITKEGIS